MATSWRFPQICLILRHFHPTSSAYAFCLYSVFFFTFFVCFWLHFYLHGYHNSGPLVFVICLWHNITYVTLCHEMTKAIFIGIITRHTLCSHLFKALFARVQAGDRTRRRELDDLANRFLGVIWGNGVTLLDISNFWSDHKVNLKELPQKSIFRKNVVISYDHGQGQ